MNYQLCLLSAFFIGTLYADTPEPKRRCPPLELTNGVVEIRANGLQARVSCNPPYTLDGSLLVVCTRNGTWNRSPQCLDVKWPKQPSTVFAAINPASSPQHQTSTVKPTQKAARSRTTKTTTRKHSTSTSPKVRMTTPVATATTNLLSATLLSRPPSTTTAKPSTKEMKTVTPAKQSTHSSTTIKTTTLVRDTIAPSATQPPLLEIQQTEHSSLSSSSLLSETKSSPSGGTTVAGDKDIPTMPASHDVTQVPHSELSSKTDDNSILTLQYLHLSQSSRSQSEGAIEDLATNEAQSGTPSSQTDTSVLSSTDSYLPLPSEPPDMGMEKATDGFISGGSSEIGIHPFPSEVDHPPPDQPSVSEPEPEPTGDNDQEQTNKQKEASDVGNGDKETFKEDLPSVPSIGIKPVRKGDKSTVDNLRLIIGVSFVVAAGMAVISYIVYRWEKRNRKRREEKKKNVGDAHGSPGPEDQTAVLMTKVDTNNTTERNLDPVDQKNGTTINTEVTPVEGLIDLGGQTSVLVSSPAVTDEEKLADLKSGTASNGNIAEIESKPVSNGTGTGLLGGTANGDILGSNPNPVDTSSGLLGTEIDTILGLSHDDKKVGMMTNDVTLTEIKIDSVV